MKFDYWIQLMGVEDFFVNFESGIDNLLNKVRSQIINQKINKITL